MKKSCILLLISLTFLFISFSKSSGGEVPDNLDSLMRNCNLNDLFSGTILAVYNGNTVFEKSYGFSDRSKNILNSNDTKYNIGSIGKLFTAIMILQLADENKISTEDFIGKYLNNFPAEISKTVRIVNLLKHNSGFGDYIQNPEFNLNKKNYRQVSDLLKIIETESLMFPPGTEFRYSNSGYVILGAVIESVTGKSYTENLSERILNPLNMNSSGFIYENESITDPKKSIGYIKNIKGVPEDNLRFQLQPSPAGGMYSTAGDLMKLDYSLMNNNILLPDRYKVILLSDFDENIDKTFSGLKSVSRNVYAGGAPGINALYMQLPGKGYTIIILSNYDRAAEAIEKPVTDIINGKNYEMPKLPLGQFLYDIYEKNGPEYFSTELKNVIKENGYEIDRDGILNNTGYQFLQNELAEAALEIFKLNAELFPDVSNCYDSLGEAYFVTGNNKEALKNYDMVLKLDPGNENAKRMIEKIK